MINGFVIVAVLVFVSILLYCVSRKKSLVMLGLIFAGIHLAFVLYATTYDYFHQSEWIGSGFGWLYFIDMPISLPIFSVGGSLELSGRVAKFCFPLAYFGVLGSAQYFLLGLFLGFLLRKSTKNVR